MKRILFPALALLALAACAEEKTTRVYQGAVPIPTAEGVPIAVQVDDGVYVAN